MHWCLSVLHRYLLVVVLLALCSGGWYVREKAFLAFSGL